MHLWVFYAVHFTLYEIPIYLHLLRSAYHFSVSFVFCKPSGVFILLHFKQLCRHGSVNPGIIPNDSWPSGPEDMMLLIPRWATLVVLWGYLGPHLVVIRIQAAPNSAWGPYGAEIKQRSAKCLTVLFLCLLESVFLRADPSSLQYICWTEMNWPTFISLLDWASTWEFPELFLALCFGFLRVLLYVESVILIMVECQIYKQNGQHHSCKW